MLYEVVDGQVVEKMMGARETEIATILAGFLIQFVRPNRLGRILVEFLFRIDVAKDLQRRPDVGVCLFRHLAVWPSGTERADLGHRPRLAVEVISQSNRAFEVQKKIHEYFAAGVSRVWVIYPEQAEVYVYSTPKQVQVLGAGQELDGGDLLPGFRLPVSVLFEDDPE